MRQEMATQPLSYRASSLLTRLEEKIVRTARVARAAALRCRPTSEALRDSVRDRSSSRKSWHRSVLEQRKVSEII